MSTPGSPTSEESNLIPTGIVDIEFARNSAKRLQDEYSVHKQACDQLATRTIEAKQKWNEVEYEIERDAQDSDWEGWPQQLFNRFEHHPSGEAISCSDFEDSDSEICVADCEDNKVEDSDDEIGMIEEILEMGHIFGFEETESEFDNQILDNIEFPAEAFPTFVDDDGPVSDDEDINLKRDRRANAYQSL